MFLNHCHEFAITSLLHLGSINEQILDMTILKKIKSVFIVPEEESTKESVPTQKLDNNRPETSSEQTSVSKEGKQKFYEILANVLEKNNMPGFDYIEFKRAVKSVSEMHQMEEGVVYKTAFATAQAMNVQSKVLIDSAQKYISILETEKTSFSQSAQKFLDQQINGRKIEIDALESEIRSIQTEIKRLTESLTDKESKVNKMKETTDSVKLKYESNKVDFEEAYQLIVAQIEEDVQKMQKYLS
ncbi:MAG: hypothetical protein IPH93_09675 [Saprospiraceae bacterium]|nr:hypothetical protein [Saprospiraceae bacterium]